MEWVPWLLHDNWNIAVAVFVAALLVLSVRAWLRPGETPLDFSHSEPQHCGDITLQELAKYNGRDYFRPIYVAIKGQIFDVTDARDFYGPGGSYQVFAGKECARALGKMAIEADQCTGQIADLTRRELEILDDWELKFNQKYTVVGKVVEPKSLTLAQLREYNGSEEAKPIYLSICGTIFDVSKGREFYGPDGMYPFAGHECARAFALLSTDTADCNNNLEGLNSMDRENLRDWQAKFHSKYSIVGEVVAS
ncbi:hypothetical protein WJX73_004926 [Symbiochloris irregularis]|uniref:Cytochrome b5 heme-binding domain-containing protein n=1 Tax=Symbiochloris irregularis TaxID=706552 RepID=A0AAW1NXV5_9CHLO